MFYDGGCGLCHRSVRFLLARDPAGRLRFAPLQSAAGRDLPAGLPDSLVFRDARGGVRVRSAAILAALTVLGGRWRLLAGLLWLIPWPLRDLAYDGVARVRHRLFARPAAACPVIPPEWRGRFLA